jgi:hypothetical protein
MRAGAMSSIARNRASGKRPRSGRPSPAAVSASRTRPG